MDSPQKPRICISVCEPTIAALERAIASAARVSDLLELRLDCLDAIDLQTGTGLITKLVQKAPGEVILTFRPSPEGG